MLAYRPESPQPLWYMGNHNQVSRATKQYVRIVDGITIIFWSKDTIYVLGKPEKFMITRWDDTYGTYRRWRNLVLSLQRRNVLTAADIRALAYKHDFVVQGLRSAPPAIDGIAKLKEHYTW